MTKIPHGIARKKAGTINMGNGEVIDYFEPVMGNVEVEMNFVQYYHWTLAQLCKLTKCASDLVQFMSIKMDKENIVDFGRRQKEEFCELSAQGKVEYALRTIDNALGELKQKNLIRPAGKGRGAYLVNPKYFFKDTAEKRLEFIKFQLTFERDKEMSVEIETNND